MMETRTGVRGTAIILTCALALVGCTTYNKRPEAVEDMSGVTESEAMGLSLAEQYALAGDRYRELNERFAELQREIFEDEWQDGSVRSEVIPGQGGTLGNELTGATNDNSYYFWVDRWHDADGNLGALVAKIGSSWESRGWDVVTETSQVNGALRVTAMTSERFWFAADEEKGTLRLSGSSPAYWGDRRALSRATAERRDAENAAGATWDTTDRDEKNRAYRLPGVYRPFPAWDAVPAANTQEQETDSESNGEEP